MGEPMRQLPEDDRPDFESDVSSIRQKEEQPELLDDISRSSTQDSKDNSTPNDTVGNGFVNDESPHKINFKAKFLNKKVLLGGGISAAVAGVLVSAFLSLAPLKVVSIMNMVQRAGSSSVDDATSRMSDRIMTNYLVRKVVPGMVSGRCSSTLVSKSCAIVSDATNPVSATYRSWRDANLEGKLAKDSGVEIIRRNNNFYLRTNKLKTELDLGTYDANNTRSFDNKAFTQLSRSDIRAEIRAASEGQTLRKRIMYRYSVGKLLERKYGIRRCVIACTSRDKITDKIELKKQAFKLKFVERVIAPRSTMMGIIMGCAFSSFECDKRPDTADANGERPSQFESDLRNSLANHRTNFGDEGLADLNEESKKLEKDGFVKYMIRRLAGETAGKIATKFIPVVGWVDLGARLQRGAENAGPALKHMNYVMNAASMVAVFALYSTNADEIKSGNIDATMAGSVANSFSSDPSKDQGGGGAETSNLYNSIVAGKNDQNITQSLSFFPSAKAASTTDISKKCDDGKPQTTILCPEEGFGKNSKAENLANITSEFANANPVGKIAAAAWLKTGGLVFDGIGWLVGKAASAIPTPKEFEELVGWVTKNIVGKVIINPFTNNPSGARLIDMAFGGSVVSSNDYAKTKLGGKVLTPQKLVIIDQRQKKQDAEDFNALPLYARMFDTESPQSFISRAALSIPTSQSSSLIKLTSYISNPFKTFSVAIGGLVDVKKVDAAPNATALVTKFGMDGYGYDDNDAIFEVGLDLEQYWESNNCSDPDTIKDWGSKATQLNPYTQEPMQLETNPCLLLCTTSTTSGAIYNKELLNMCGDDSPDAGASPDTIDVAGLKDIFQPSDSIPCEAGASEGVQDGYYKGTKIRVTICNVGGIRVNSRIAKNVQILLDTAKSQGVILNGGGFRSMADQQRVYATNCRNGKCSVPTAKPGTSNHQMGLAIDFSYGKERSAICFPHPSSQCNGHPGFEWLKANAGKFGLQNFKKEAWHWSVDGS